MDFLPINPNDPKDGTGSASASPSSALQIATIAATFSEIMASSGKSLEPGIGGFTGHGDLVGPSDQIDRIRDDAATGYESRDDRGRGGNDSAADRDDRDAGYREAAPDPGRGTQDGRDRPADDTAQRTDPSRPAGDEQRNDDRSGQDGGDGTAGNSDDAGGQNAGDNNPQNGQTAEASGETKTVGDGVAATAGSVAPNLDPNTVVKTGTAEGVVDPLLAAAAAVSGNADGPAKVAAAATTSNHGQASSAESGPGLAAAVAPGSQDLDARSDGQTGGDDAKRGPATVAPLAEAGADPLLASAAAEATSGPTATAGAGTNSGSAASGQHGAAQGNAQGNGAAQSGGTAAEAAVAAQNQAAAQAAAQTAARAAAAGDGKGGATTVQGANGANGLQGAGGDASATGGPGNTTDTNATQRANQTQAPAQARPAVLSQPLVDQVSVQITKAVQQGLDRINIQLRPPELGRIQVQLEVSGDGRVTAIVTADNRATLDMLQRDARGLEQALQDAGLELDSGSLSFNLRDRGDDGEPTSPSDGADRPPVRSAEDEVPLEDLISGGSPITMATHGRVDIRA